MRGCTLNERRAGRVRVATCASVVAVLAFLGATGTGPAAAVEFEVGELRANVDTTVTNIVFQSQRGYSVSKRR